MSAFFMRMKLHRTVNVHFGYPRDLTFHGQYKEMRFLYKQLFLLGLFLTESAASSWHSFCSISIRFICHTPYYL
ncbi:hypothetical protein D3C87_696890 [compost metagenome]|uniref:Uncharacterized protein n=1 Tax=Pseudomonas fluorescens TaxID=294 RepID=A0A8H2NUF1_PSEFL|nr:hypothetical protein PS861_03977 [Pseudomonas fluorescens]VVP25676.1 hypothetical protein PS900_04087 [Pseudomonas fluorescens]